VLKEDKVLRSLVYKVHRAFKVQLDFKDDKASKDLRDHKVVKVLLQQVSQEIQVYKVRKDHQDSRDVKVLKDHKVVKALRQQAQRVPKDH
jgi:ribosomal 50S subunit-recycling heat shock protein